MELFKGQSLLEFTERFKTDLDCEEYLASLKWKDGYCCRKCGHKKYLIFPQNHYEQYLTNILVKQHKLLLTNGKDINL